MTNKILFITSNEKKVKEVKAITGLDVEARNLNIPEIQSLNVEEVAKAKAAVAFKIVGSPVMVDDTAMTIEALNGLPGALVTWFLKKLQLAGILKLIAGETNRKASVSTCIVYADHTGVYVFTGTVNGKLSDSIRGDRKFGFDQIFIPDGHDKTYAEMTDEDKNEISMRKIALLKFKEFIFQRK